MQQVVPALRVRSYEASSAFYGKLGFASIARDRMEIYLTQHSGDCQCGGLVHFYVANVDECYAEFQQRGIPIKEPPRNSLGPDLRDMLVVDPDGNRLSFLTRSAETTE